MVGLTLSITFVCVIRVPLSLGSYCCVVFSEDSIDVYPLLPAISLLTHYSPASRTKETPFIPAAAAAWFLKSL